MAVSLDGGNNDSGQASPPAGLTGVVAIAAGYFHSVADARSITAQYRQRTYNHDRPHSALG
jgi:hypothetical protein